MDQIKQDHRCKTNTAGVTPIAINEGPPFVSGWTFHSILIFNKQLAILLVCIQCNYMYNSVHDIFIACLVLLRYTKNAEHEFAQLSSTLATMH